MRSFDITKILEEKESMLELLKLVKKKDKLVNLYNKKNSNLIKDKINEVYIEMLALGYIPSYYENVTFIKFKIDKHKSSFCNENNFNIFFKNTVAIRILSNNIKIKNINKIVTEDFKLVEFRISEYCKFHINNSDYNLYKNDFIQIYDKHGKQLITLHFYNKWHNKFNNKKSVQYQTIHNIKEKIKISDNVISFDKNKEIILPTGEKIKAGYITYFKSGKIKNISVKQYYDDTPWLYDEHIPEYNIIKIPNGERVKCDFISFYESGKIESINLTEEYKIFIPLINDYGYLNFLTFNKDGELLIEKVYLKGKKDVLINECLFIAYTYINFDLETQEIINAR